MSEVTDITPDFQPLALLRANEERAKDSTCALLLLVNAEGDLYWDGCGVTQQNLIWALRKFEHEILSGGYSNE
jgi:hypothetical protein